jgi:PAS domain S-box-containing protein
MSEDNFKHLTENATTGILIFNSKGRPLFANRQVSEITGYRRSELMKAECSEIVPPDEVEKFRAAANRLLQEEIVSHNAELKITPKDCHPIPLEISIAKTS